MKLQKSTIDLVESSFSQTKKIKVAFSEHFYKTLFEKNPELQPLFSHTTVKEQAAKLYAALVLLVENIRHPEELERVLSPLGEKHKAYGVVDQHYPLVGSALLETLEYFLKDAWTPEIGEAWSSTFWEVTRVMLRGAGMPMPVASGVPANKGVADKKMSTGGAALSNTSKLTRFELIQQSFQFIKPHREEFSARFYDTLFETSPQLRPLFQDAGMKKQSSKLYGALVLLVENIRNPGMLEKVLMPMGEKHKQYGVIAEHYPLVRQALLNTMAFYLKEHWTPPVKKAWEDTYGEVVDIMLRGAKDEITESSATVGGSGVPLSQPGPQESSEDLKKYEKSISVKQKESWLNKKPVFTKMADWFWATSKWKIAVIVSLLFFSLVPLENQFPILKDYFDIIDAISIVLAMLLYIKESPERKKQFHYQAWSIVDGAHGIKKSYARFIALQDLADDNVSLKGLNLAGAELSGIELSGAELSEASFEGAALNNAILYKASLNNAIFSNAACTSIVLAKSNLGFASLRKGKFSSADFSEANLMFADMSEGNFSGANFRNAKLKGVRLEGAYLSGANLEGADINIEDMEGAYLVQAIMPDGSTHA